MFVYGYDDDTIKKMGTEFNSYGETTFNTLAGKITILR